MSSPWSPQATTTPGCYRHAAAPAPVRCTRCERPICTACMVSAPVGWQCPDCARGGPAVTRMRDVQPGGTLAGGRPPLTLALIAVNVVLFLLQQGSAEITGRYALSAFGVDGGRWYQVVTAGFLHGGVIHVLFNCLLLYQLGSAIEERLGTARYAALYLFSLLGGSLGQLVLGRPGTLSLGASGAVFGLMGAIVALRGARRSSIEASVGGLIVVNLLITFALPGIAIGGHLGGLVAGGVGGLVLRVLGERRGAGPVALAVGILLAGSAALAAAAIPVAGWAIRTGGLGIG